MLQTERCILTSLSKEDFNNILILRTNQKVRQFLGGTLSEAAVKSRFLAMLDVDASVHHWVVRADQDGAFMGLLTLDQHHNDVDQEISYEFLPEWWGKGYAAETVSAVIHYAFYELGCSRVVAETQTANTLSICLLERLGFELEQTVERFGAEQGIYVISAQ